MALNPKKNLKLYYSISEVASMFDLNESLLRFWEKEFPSLNPHKGGRGIRQYTKDDIQVIRTVYHLVKEKGMTLQGAREVMKRDKQSLNSRIDVIDRLKHVRDELQAINKEFNSLT